MNAHRLFPGLAAGVLSSIHPGAMPAHAQTATCEVNVHQAWSTAQNRGWRFECNISGLALPGAVALRLFLPDPPNRVMCQIRTGPVPVAPTVEANFFVHSQVATPGLRNGWQVHQFEFSGVQWYPPVSVTASRRYARINALTVLGRAGHTTHMRLSRLVLRKTGGTCANALDEAF